MIGCTILVWKYGPLEGDPTWPADLGIFFQCFILFIVSLIHFFAWGNIVMTNTPILLASAVGGFILQVIEEQFLLIPRYEWRVINLMVTGWRYWPIESKFSFLNGTNSKWVSAYDRNLRWIWKAEVPIWSSNIRFRFSNAFIQISVGKVQLTKLHKNALNIVMNMRFTIM